jgi:hypothetical protein
MRWIFKSKLKGILAALLIGGLLLAFVASHGCDAKGASPSESGAAQDMWSPILF